jgi:hypothetical protein
VLQLMMPQLMMRPSTWCRQQREQSMLHCKVLLLRNTGVRYASCRDQYCTHAIQHQKDSQDTQHQPAVAGANRQNILQPTVQHLQHYNHNIMVVRAASTCSTGAISCNPKPT